jgi:hypothetical protein
MTAISASNFRNPDLARLPPNMALMLQFTADHREPFSRFLCRRGRYFDTVRPCPESWRGRLGECYANAGRLALLNHDLTYVEGYGWNSSLGCMIRHAWVVDAEGQAIDPTWTYEGTWCVWKEWIDLSGNDACEGLKGMLDPRWHLQSQALAAEVSPLE